MLPREEAILHTESQIMITDSLDRSQEVSASSHFPSHIWWQQQSCLMGKKGEEHPCPWECCSLRAAGAWALGSARDRAKLTEVGSLDLQDFH